MLTAKANSLVAGTTSRMDKTLTVRALRQFYYSGILQATGTVLTMPTHLALEAVHLKRVEIVSEADLAKPVEPAIEQASLLAVSTPEPGADELKMDAEPRRPGRPRKEDK